MNDRTPAVKAVTLAYFSGTGGTKAIVSCFETQFIKSGIHVNVIDISRGNTYHEEKASDLLIIFSPVYAFRLTTLVEQWIKNLPKTQNMPAAVISVSGGGEISPNTACRVHCKRLLVKKGYHMIYEKMFVMPSNYASQADYQINLQLLHVIPQKVTQAITEILSGKIALTKPRVLDRFFAFIGKAEHFGAKIFGLSIHASKECTQCGLCERKCPANNIKIQNGLPKFGSNCMWCLKCIYDCPHHALSPGAFKFSVLKDGYNLTEMSEQAKTQCDAEHQPSGSMLWQGVMDYLKE
ncbi:EFR1 family ferrodoxin [Lacrimispora sp.]|uniref:EFR1 family ferrodoxin n=1 Tax=Lacrimispora sp. TaxID=2719234 RepID=UPI0028A01F5B|nr:EFR1 family ferrodoxin [Lacrimispora sp.]